MHRSTASTAGIDVLLYASEADSGAAYSKLLAAAQDRKALPGTSLVASWSRIEALKHSLS